MNAPYPLDRLDDAVGDLIERGILAHHRRRLARGGHARALDGSGGAWAGGSFPPRRSAVEFLVDGSEILPRMVEDIAGARSHVHICGWHFTPEFRMGDGGPTLKELLAATAERVDVRVLAWAGSPLPLFRPARSDVRTMRERLVDGTRVALQLDARERPMHCHHEKLVVVDDRVAYVGGLDLTTLAGDRLDSSAHPRRDGVGWHDTCVRVDGELAADVGSHFRLRWVGDAPAGTPVPAADGIAAQLVRTVPEQLYDGLLRGEFTILESYRRELAAAERLVYLENQFLWSPELVSVLAAKLREPPRQDFRVLVLLPAKPNNGADDTRGQLGVLVNAAKEGGDENRFLACTLFQPHGNTVYVHAKVGVVDDRWFTTGSANLNEHSLFNDTEVNVVVQDEEFARAARRRLWSEHLERDATGEPSEVIDELWRPLAREQSPGRKLRGLRGVSRRTRALLGPLNGLVVDG